jgi:hypothetical protein
MDLKDCLEFLEKWDQEDFRVREDSVDFPVLQAFLELKEDQDLMEMLGQLDPQGLPEW